MLRYLNAWLVYPLAERCQGRQIRSKAQQIRAEMRLPFAARHTRRPRQLAAVLAAAARDVPYYRDLFRALRFNPARVADDPRYLEELPYLTKEIVREQGARLLSERFTPAQLHVRRTGGSTGPSALVYYSTPALDWTAAINLVALEWAGKRRQDVELHLASRFPETFPWRDRLKECVKCLALNRHNAFTDDWEPAALERLWQKICRVRPYLVQGHPSSLYALALHLRDRGRDGRGILRVFESTGEALDQKKRETIEGVLGCRVLNRFGNAEFGIVAYESLDRRDRRLQLFDCVVWPEQIEHESGRPELVLTGLLNEAMPLVRYRTGDLAQVLMTDDGLVLEEITGRVHDVVSIGNRRYPTHFIQDVLDRIGGIDEFQVEPRPGQPLLLRLVVGDASRRPAVAQRIRQWWADDVAVEFAGFGGLARTGWRGKFRYVVERQAA